MTTLGFDPDATPAILAALVDTGRWRERGITHWHLVQDDQPYTSEKKENRKRFDSVRIRGLVNRPMVPVAHTPLDALSWLVNVWLDTLAGSPTPGATATRRGWHDDAAWRFQVEHCWDTLAGGSSTPAGGSLPIGANVARAAHCYPISSARCRAHDRV